MANNKRKYFFWVTRKVYFSADNLLLPRDITRRIFVSLCFDGYNATKCYKNKKYQWRNRAIAKVQIIPMEDYKKVAGTKK